MDDKEKEDKAAKVKADKAAKVKADKEAKVKADADAKEKSEANKGEYVGKELTLRVGDMEFKGLCTGDRDTNSGKQVYLKISGEVARYFDVADIVK